MSTRMHMPSLGGATEWINSAPLRPDQLRGHVVLVDFWTFTCINWLRTEPYIRAWSQAYRNDGLIVIGVHTPEFSFEHEIDRVRLATKDRAIDYPVAVDNDYEIWRAFDNHYWPALYFVDADGVIRDQHFGEGRYDQSERLIQQLLGVERAPRMSKGSAWRRRPTGTTCGRRRRISAMDARSISRHRAVSSSTNDAGTDCPTGCASVIGRSTANGRSGGSAPCSIRPAAASSTGSTRGTRISSCRPERAGRFAFRVLLDGEAPGPSAGEDVDEDGNGTLLEGRLYQLVRIHDAVRERTLQITFLEPGAEAYVFTFG